jgi:hypothetical protein
MANRLCLKRSTHYAVIKIFNRLACRFTNLMKEKAQLHNEELNDPYHSQTIIWLIKSRRMRWAGHVEHMEEGRGAYKVLVGKPEGNRTLGRFRRRWEDNFKMDLQEMGWGHGLD